MAKKSKKEAGFVAGQSDIGHRCLMCRSYQHIGGGRCKLVKLADDAVARRAGQAQRSHQRRQPNHNAQNG